jgi:hypothetical protein
MVRTHQLVVATTFCVAVLAAAASCSTDVEAEIGLVLTSPQGLLDEATSMNLRVFPAEGRSCGADGAPSEVPEGAQEFQLQREGCDAGVAWCTEITLPKDGSEQMFAVEARNAAGLLALGCGTATMDQDPVEVSIKIVRYVAPACCGDGILQPTELCDTGPQGGTCSAITSDEVCEADCSTKAIPVERVSTDPPLGAIGQGQLAITFAPGLDQLSGGLRAAYTSGGSTSDIGLRFFQSDLRSVTVPAALATPRRAIFNCSGNELAIPRQQSAPAVAASDTGSFVAFLSNKDIVTRTDVAIFALSDAGCSAMAETTLSDKVAAAANVDLASNGGLAFVVWDQGGQVLGRTWSEGAGAGPIVTIATSGARPRVARGASGWLVVYEGADGADADGVFATEVADDSSISAALLVNAKRDGLQDQPDVAALPDGRWAVVWRSGADVFFQRFGADATPTSGDQESPLATTTEGDQAEPAIVSGSSGDYFATAWSSGAEIRARLIGGESGFLFNPRTGQNDDFAVTDGGQTPRRPTLAVGEHLAIGWEEQAGPNAGIYVRRFPLPTQ